MNSFNLWRRATAASLLVALAGTCGCSAQRATEVEVFVVSVTLAGDPVENVRVALVNEDDRQGPVLLEGVSNYDGRAGMKVVGAAAVTAPSEFAVVCESLGDWKIIEPWASAPKSPLTITWSGESELNVELPKKSVRRL